MSNIRITVDLNDLLRIKLQDSESGDQADLIGGVTSGEDTQVEGFEFTPKCTAELVYRASIQPCVVVGLALDGVDEVAIVSNSDKSFRLVVATASEKGYNDPIVDTMVDSGEGHVEKFAVV